MSVISQQIDADKSEHMHKGFEKTSNHHHVENVI